MAALNPTYKVTFTANGCSSVYADDRFIGMIYKSGKRYHGHNVNDVRIATTASLGAALDVVIDVDHEGDLAEPACTCGLTGTHAGYCARYTQEGR